MKDVLLYRGREIARIHNGEIVMTSDVKREELCEMLIEVCKSNSEREQRSIELSKLLFGNSIVLEKETTTELKRIERLPD